MIRRLPLRWASKKMKSRQLALAWLAINVLGMGGYLFFASSLWVKPEEQGTPGGPGDAFYWLFTLVPILVAFAVFNIAALVKVVIEYRRTHSLIPLLLWVIVLSVWFNVLVVDRIKGIRYIDSKYAQNVAPPDAANTAAQVG